MKAFIASTVVAVLLLLAPAANAATDPQCTQWDGHNRQACHAVLSLIKRFFAILTDKKTTKKTKVTQLFTLWNQTFSREDIVRTLVVKVFDRTAFKTLKPHEHRRIAQLIGQYGVKGLVYGEIGSNVRNSTNITVKVTRVKRSASTIVVLRAKGKMSVNVSVYLNKRSLKVKEIAFSGGIMIRGRLINSQANQVDRFARGESDEIWKIKRDNAQNPGVATILIMEKLLSGSIKTTFTPAAGDR